MLRISEKRNVSTCLRSNLLDLLHSFSASVPVSPFSPKIMIHTLASVPAPVGTGESRPFRENHQMPCSNFLNAKTLDWIKQRQCDKR